MKAIKFSMLAVAAMAAFACAKEVAPETPANDSQVKENANLVEITLAAKGETKAVFSNYPGLAWEATDKISVLGTNTGNQEFQADGKGAETTFTGMADLTDEVLYAVYPADANITLADGKLSNVTIPAVQKATAGQFDPKAFVAVAKSEDKENLYFMGIGSFVKFKVEDAENVKSVTLFSNSGANMACSATVYEENEEFKHGSPYVAGTASSYVTLEGDFAADQAYFMVVRASSYADGVTVFIEYKDGTVLSRRGTSALFETGKSRNYICDLGTLQKSKFSTPTDEYMLYTLGYDLTVGDKKINKETYGAATLITANSSSKGLGKTGVYFVASDATATFNSGIENLVVIGYGDTRANVTRTQGLSYVSATDADNVLIMKNVKYEALETANLFQLNQGKAYETIYFENCYFNVGTGKNLILSNSAANSVTDFAMVDCDVKVAGSVSLVKMGGSTINSVKFVNNVIFADEVMDAFVAFHSAAKITNVTLDNNTFYNTTIGTATANEDGVILANTVANFHALNNYLVYANSTANRYLCRSTITTGEVDNNFYVRKADTSTAIYGVNGTKPEWVTNQPAPKGAPATLTTNWDPANGSFVLGGYNGVGATR